MIQQENIVDLFRKIKSSNVPENQYWQLINEYLETKARHKRIPLTGLFELTPYCNLDCKMCYVHIHKSEDVNKPLLSVDDWKGIMSQAFLAGMREAKLSGGECLMYPGFDDLYLYLYSKHIGVGVATNGILLDKRRINFFKQYKPDSIQISLYGSNDNAYHRVTGHSCFGIVYENLMLCKEAKLPVKIAITPSVYMLNDFDNLLKLVESLGIPYRVNAFLFKPRNNTNRDFDDMTTKEYVEVFKKWNEIKNIELTKCDIDTDKAPTDESNRENIYGLKCGAGRSSFAVLYDGKMVPCVTLEEEFADTLSEGFKTSWEHVIQIANNYPIPVECSNCAIQNKCFFCAASHKNANKLGHCDRAICDRVREYIREGLL